MKKCIYAISFICMLIGWTASLGVPSVKAALTGSVFGKIIDADGNPLKGVTVQLVNETNSQGVKTAKTNKKGRFRFVQVVPGTYKINANMESLKPVTYNQIRVSTNARIKIKFTLYPEDMLAVTEAGPAGQSSPSPQPTSARSVIAPKKPDTGIKTDGPIHNGL